MVKKYNILGISAILSIKKGWGYGKILVKTIVDYLKKKGKTGLGFCAYQTAPFYEKCGLKTAKNFGWRFILKNPKTGEEKSDDENCAGIYYNGKDNFIKKVLETKSVAEYYIPEMEIPHW